MRKLLGGALIVLAFPVLAVGVGASAAQAAGPASSGPTTGIVVISGDGPGDGPGPKAGVVALGGADLETGVVDGSEPPIIRS